MSSPSSSSFYPPVSHTPTSLRTKRSRKDRPCDECRRLKRPCIIQSRDQPCQFCWKRNRACTFAAPPTARKRPPKPVPPSSLSHILVEGASHIDHSPDTFMAETRWNLTRLINGDENGEDSSETETATDDEYHLSLDLETADMDMHYLGSGAIGDQVGPTLSSGDVEQQSAEIGLSIRQVSKDLSKPAYFIRNPGLLYGRLDSGSAESAYMKITSLLSSVDPSWPDKLMIIFLERALPAMPILNSVRLEAARKAWQGGGPFPYALMATIMAYTLVYVPSLRYLHRQAWAIILALLDDEYRQPRLQVLQIAVIDLLARPNSNHGGNCIALARAGGVARLLGLHVDCSDWKLPMWEKSVRKRLWWTLYIHDQWSCLVYGRPGNINAKSHNVPLPTLEDDDWGGQSIAPTGSMASFIVMCRLSCILERLLDTSTLTYTARMDLTQSAAREMDELQDSLPTSDEPGVDSMKLSHLAVCQVITRLRLDGVEASMPRGLIIALNACYETCDNIVCFVEELQASSCSSFWLPYSSHQLSSTVSTLLRVALVASRATGSGRSKIIAFEGKARTAIQRLLAALRTCVQAYDWDVAGGVLERSKILIRSVSRELPEMGQLLPPEPTNHVPIASSSQRSTDIDYGLLNFEDMSPEKFLEDIGWLHGEVDLLNLDFFRAGDAI